jgi:hypothetical protein
MHKQHFYLSSANLYVNPDTVEALNDIVLKLNNIRDVSYSVKNINGTTITIQANNLKALKKLLEVFT